MLSLLDPWLCRRGPMKLVLSVRPSVMHFSQKPLDGFSWFFAWRSFAIIGKKWRSQIFENILWCPKIWVNEANLGQKWYFGQYIKFIQHLRVFFVWIHYFYKFFQVLMQYWLKKVVIVLKFWVKEANLAENGFFGINLSSYLIF